MATQNHESDRGENLKRRKSHARNKYAQNPPDFVSLAVKYPWFGAVVNPEGLPRFAGTLSFLFLVDCQVGPRRSGYSKNVCSLFSSFLACF